MQQCNFGLAAIYLLGAGSLLFLPLVQFENIRFTLYP